MKNLIELSDDQINSMVESINPVQKWMKDHHLGQWKLEISTVFARLRYEGRFREPMPFLERKEISKLLADVTAPVSAWLVKNHLHDCAIDVTIHTNRIRFNSSILSNSAELKSLC